MAGLDNSSTPTIVETIPFGSQTYWAVNADTTDVTTAVNLKAAPGTGKSLYLTSVVISCDDADANPYLVDDAGVILFGPLMSTVEGIVVVKEFSRPIKLAENTALMIKSVAGGAISIYVEGATADDQ